MSVLFVEVEQQGREGYLRKEMESPNFSTITCNNVFEKMKQNNNDSVSKGEKMNGSPNTTSSNDMGALTIEDEGEDDDVDDEVQSELKGSLGSIGSLEESLPIKRGLSSFYSGKSQSFANLAEATTVTDLAKPENLLNKKRRLLRATKWYSTEDLHSISALNDDDQGQKCIGQNIKRCKTDHYISSCSHDGRGMKQ